MKLKKLSDIKIKKLENIYGWYWVLNDEFNEKYLSLIGWINKNRRIPSNKSNNIEEKILGTWCSHRRSDNKKGILSEDKIKKLEQIKEWYWSGKK